MASFVVAALASGEFVLYPTRATFNAGYQVFCGG
jgi:hypothetical protein